MNRGQIVRWMFVSENNNRGIIVGCFNGVHGQPFGFTINDVVNPSLATFLRTNHMINVAPNCDPDAHAFWVNFFPVGTSATNIS